MNIGFNTFNLHITCTRIIFSQRNNAFKNQ
nr:MAG TPA: hypothetical protein [Caudoviricetes sp.]